MKACYIIDAVRTPVGKYSGALSSIRPDDLLAHVIKALLQRNPGIDVNAIEDVIAGDANQAGEDNRNVARMAALLAGLPGYCCGQYGESFMCQRHAGNYGCHTCSDVQ